MFRCRRVIELRKTSRRLSQKRLRLQLSRCRCPVKTASHFAINDWLKQGIPTGLHSFCENVFSGAVLKQLSRPATKLRIGGIVGIDYVVDLDCPAKQALSVEKMVSLVKSKNQAMTVIEFLRREGDQRPTEELSFTRVVVGPEGEVKQDINVGAMLEQVQELNVHSHHCDGCKANLFQSPYGCYGSISYPIAESAETWLMSLLPQDLKSLAGNLLKSAVSDLNYTGGMFLDMRPQEMFFESRRPVNRKWGSLFSRWEITSDQVLEMLFGLGNLEPSHCEMMCMILGMAHLEGDPDSTPPPPPPDDQSRQLADAFNAMALAAELGVGLLIDA